MQIFHKDHWTWSVLMCIIRRASDPRPHSGLTACRTPRYPAWAAEVSQVLFGPPGAVSGQIVDHPRSLDKHCSRAWRHTRLCVDKIGGDRRPGHRECYIHLTEPSYSHNVIFADQNNCDQHDLRYNRNIKYCKTLSAD